MQLTALSLALTRIGLGGFGVGSALNLDFTSGNRTLDPRITFARASNATVTGPDGVLESVAIDGPRFDYDPVSLQPKGLLIEEQRTNSIRNSTGQGAVVGAPGTLPTNWTFNAGSTGISSEVIGTGAEGGVSYIDIRYSGTAAATASFSQRLESANSISALTGQTWAMSAWVKAQAGSLMGIAAVNHQYIENTSSGVFVTSTNVPIVVDSTLTRQATSRTLSGGATVAFLSGGISVTVITGAAIDITLRIGLPQLEQGAFATSPIPTTTAAATRAADIAVMTGANFSNWYRQDEGTLFAEAGVLAASYTTGVLADIGAGGAFGSTAYINWFGSGWAINPNVAPVNMLVSVTGSMSAKIAAGLAGNNTAISVGGLLSTVDTSCALPVSATTLSIGKGGWSGAGNFVNGHIRRIGFFPRRLTNAELQGLTA